MFAFLRPCIIIVLMPVSKVHRSLYPGHCHVPGILLHMYVPVEVENASHTSLSCAYTLLTFGHRYACICAIVGVLQLSSVVSSVLQ